MDLSSLRQVSVQVEVVEVEGSKLNKNALNLDFRLLLLYN